METTREKIRTLAGGIVRINKSGVKLPFKVNYAVQRTLEAIKPEAVAIDAAIKVTTDDLGEKMKAIQKTYADKTKNEKGEEIPVVKDGQFVVKERESELSAALEALVVEKAAKEKEMEAFLKETVNVPDFFMFDITKEDKAKMEELGGDLAVLLPLIKSVAE